MIECEMISELSFAAGMLMTICIGLFIYIFWTLENRQSRKRYFQIADRLTKRLEENYKWKRKKR